MPGDHALLSPSSSSRWLACTRAPRLEEKLPNTAGDAATEGDTAHKIVELMARKRFTDPMGPAAYKKELKKLEKKPFYNPEMVKCGQEYLDFLDQVVMEFKTKPDISIEYRVSLESTIPECWGRCDFAAMGGDLLHVVDYKYGQGLPVPAEKNSQLMLYAAGFLLTFGPFSAEPIKRVKISIFQPRREGASTWETTADDIMNWIAFDVKPRAALAVAGEGEFQPGEKTCMFCRAKGCCQARAEWFARLKPVSNTPPGVLTPEEISKYLSDGEGLAKWYDDLKSYASTSILKGTDIPGWKVVEGRSARAFADTEAALKRMEALGIQEALLYKRVPVTLTEAEKIIGKTKFETEMRDMVFKPQGKPTLVPASDSRAPYKRAGAAEDFEDIKRG